MAKVLLVEDDNNLRDIYQARLAAEGYEISTAQDGEEALVVAKQTMPDLVVSDVMMPKISGFEMLDILRNTAGLEHVKVIMLTALGQGEDRDRADSLGADKYLVKSQVTLEDIVKTAHELLGTGEPEAAAPQSDTGAPAATPAPATAPDNATPAESSAPIPEPEPVVAPPAAEPVVTPPATDDTATPTGDNPAPAATDTTDVTSVAPPDATVPPTSEPTAAASDTTTTIPAPEPTASGSAAQEEALVQEQINKFVQNTPEASATTDSTATEQPPTPPSPEAQDTATDDKLMAEAVDELASQVTGNDSAPAESAAPTPQSQPTPEPAAAPETPEPQPDTSNNSFSLSGKKVIQPLDSTPKPDIHELLAREEAANGATAPTTPTPSQPTTDTPGVPPVAPQASSSFMAPPQNAPATPADEQPSGAPAAPPSEQKNDGGIDPNSIAL